MKIQLSQERIIKDIPTIWHEHGPNVDMVMDLKALGFRQESLTEIYSFHVMDHLFPAEVERAAKNWFECLAPGGKLFVVVDDFEYICRGFVGGDLNIDVINELHNHPTQFSRDNIVGILKRAGFGEDKQVIWFDQNVADRFGRTHYELVIEATKV